MERAGNSVLWKKLHDPTSILTPRTSRWPPGNQFPSKYEQLPNIGGESPRPNQDNQVVPLRVRKSSPGNFGTRGATMDSESEERMRQLEMRLGVSEKSNRALLEEVLRLQNDLRVTTKRSEDVLKEERDSRQQLSEAIRISNELITQLSSRIKETEDKIEEEKTSLNALFSHTKNVEKTVVASTQDLIQKRDVQTQRLQELRLDLNETRSSRNQLEQIAFTLTEELRTLKSKMETQQADYNNVVQEIRNKTRKLEEENRIHMEAMRKQSDLHSMTDVTTTHLRGQVETRLSELRDVLMDLRSKHETEQNERRNLEKSMQTKINELQTSLSEQSRKREENMHSVDMVLREKEHAAQAERLQMNAKVTDTVEDVNKRLLTKEMKIREDIQAKYLQLEKMVQREQQLRQDYEKSARDDTERRWLSLKKVLEDELRSLKDSIGIERGKTKETLGKLDQSISIVEKQLVENKKQVDKVMAAEIKSRKMHETGTQEKINNVNERLQIATSSLQQAIGGVSQNLQANNEKMKRELRTIMNEQQQGSTRALSDLDARITAMKQRMANLEDTLDAKVVQSSHNLSERMHDRMEAIAKWQDSTGDTLRELGRSVQTIPQDVYQLEEKFKLMKSEMDSRVSHESDARTREVEILRQELQSLKSRMDRQPKHASLQDLEAEESNDKNEEMENNDDNNDNNDNNDPEMNVGVRKLADNLQTVKTVLGMKIQSEQKLRVSGLQDLQSQVNQLKITQGVGVNYQTTHRSQLDDLDTGLGWDDLPSSFGTGTPNTSMTENSRQHMSDPNKVKPAPIKEETREEDSPFEGGGGLKNMNIQSPTPKAYDDAAPSPKYKGNTTARRSPGNETPDNWKNTPRDVVTPDSQRGGKKSPNTAKSPGNRTPGNKTPSGGQTARQTPAGGQTARQTPTNRSPTNRTPRNQTPDSQNDGGQTQRLQDSGLNDV